MPSMNTFTFLTFTRPLAIPSDVSAALLKHSFAFVSHFIAEEGYSILSETFLQKIFLVSDNNFISYHRLFTSGMLLSFKIKFSKDRYLLNLQPKSPTARRKRNLTFMRQTECDVGTRLVFTPSPQKCFKRLRRIPLKVRAISVKNIY